MKPRSPPEKLTSHRDLIEGCKRYLAIEKRDPWYGLARAVVEGSWESESAIRVRELAGGVATLLLAWNSKYYADGPFDWRALAEQIELRTAEISKYRKRNILTFTDRDHGLVRDIFDSFDRAVKGWGKGTGPVSTAKALHLLAPSFFPLWDNPIAGGYGFGSRLTSHDYVAFMQRSAVIAKRMIEGYSSETGGQIEGAWGSISKLHPLYPGEERTLLKMLDEYNYWWFTLRQR